MDVQIGWMDGWISVELEDMLGIGWLEDWICWAFRMDVGLVLDGEMDDQYGIGGFMFGMGWMDGLGLEDGYFGRI